MQNINFCKAAMLAALFFISSCIFDAPNDKFYRTCWTTSEAPLTGLIIEFECDGYISARIETDSCGLLGTYDPCGATACFSNLNVFFDTYTIALDAAHRNNDTMIISWHFTEISPKARQVMAEGFATGISYTTEFDLVTLE